jgi:hypothetical protein
MALSFLKSFVPAVAVDARGRCGIAMPSPHWPHRGGRCPVPRPPHILPGPQKYRIPQNPKVSGYYFHAKLMPDRLLTTIPKQHFRTEPTGSLRVREPTHVQLCLAAHSTQCFARMCCQRDRRAKDTTSPRLRGEGQKRGLWDISSGQNDRGGVYPYLHIGLLTSRIVLRRRERAYHGSSNSHRARPWPLLPPPPRKSGPFIDSFPYFPILSRSHDRSRRVLIRV